jgi:hypothetical protein
VREAEAWLIGRGEMRAAERARVKHMVQFINRGLPHYRWIKHLLEDGYIGMPYHAYFTRPTGWYPPQQPNSYFWWADALRTERTSMGFAPRAELSLHRRRS